MQKYRIYNYLFFISFIALNLFLIGNAHAQTKLHSHQQIIDEVRTFVYESLANLQDNDIEVSVNPIDNRLRLAQCDQPLNLFWAPGSQRKGHTTVGIRCDGSSPWKFYHGVDIAVFEDVWVSTNQLTRGSIITKDNLSVRRMNTSRGNSRYISANQVINGLRTRRDIRSGEVLSITMLEKNDIVKRGDRVTLIARNNGIEVRAAATAKQSAASGERITVINDKTKKEVEGVLTSDFMVYVNL